MEDLIAQFLEKARSAFGDEGATIAAKAIEWSKARHEQAMRASGEPAFEHDFRVASTLLDMGMDLDSVIAGIVHDTTAHRVSGYHQPHGGELPEPSAGDAPKATAQHDQGARAQKRGGRQDQKQEEHLKEAHRKALGAVPDPAIVEEFGGGTAQIVAEVARLSSVRAKNKTVQAAETTRKMLFAMTGDIRVIIVKLADKLDSMRTLKWLPEDRQKTIAAECLDIFA
ncbi:MAG TPA: HD domain-containing protein, partial [Rectinemataceae bacterium]|nr:HD domain-containing protein [Rectinemataceae bacterium]